MSATLERLHRAGVITALDVHFARALDRISPGQPPGVMLGAALASRAVASGHVCADLREILERPLLDADGEVVGDVELPPIFEWVMELGGSPVVSGGDRATPLVFDGEARLYLTRYFRYQSALAVALRDRAAARPDDVDRHVLVAGLDRLFADRGVVKADAGQRLAAAVAVLRRLAVITGGPGTGKTTTVVRILALLVEQALAAGRHAPRIHLLAPTGKAAARLAEAILAGKAGVDCAEEVLAAIPEDAATIHRRLGYRPGHPTRFRHGPDSPLPADVVLVDEASMVDLALMAKLAAAVPAAARLILLGDKDQLASVEAGAILGDVCNAGGAGARPPFSVGFADELEAIVGTDAVADPRPRPERTGIGDCIVELRHSYRFGAGSEIGLLARAVGGGHATQALAQLTDAAPGGALALVHLGSEAQLRSIVGTTVAGAFAPVMRTSDPLQRLQRWSEYRLLCAHRRGPFGSERLNAIIEECLRAEGLVERAPDQIFYDGRPIIVTRNDYQLELYNGDVGVIALDDAGELRAYFAVGTELRAFLPARLPPHESVYAMTVHKSQGSEFDRVGLLMPPQVSPVLTRELVYTAITRAREHVTLYGERDVLVEALARRIDRASGLRDALWR